MGLTKTAILFPETEFSMLDEDHYFHPDRKNSILSAPDGERPLDKIISITRPCLIVGVGAGLMLQAVKYGNLSTAATFGRIAYCTFPIMGLGFFFVGGSYLSARIRGKNDFVNNLVGLYCTIPIVRKFVPASVAGALYSAATFSTIVTRTFNQPDRPTMDKKIGYFEDQCAVDWYLWKDAKPESEPYVKRAKSFKEFLDEKQLKLW